MSKRKTVEEKYQQISELDHILLRSGMYIGSVREESKNMFIYDNENEKMSMVEMTYTPGLLKLIDEIISNIADEYRRKDNMGLTQAELEFDRKGHFRIKDNGGIEVVKHKTAGMYVPEFIFSSLRTGSNYDDTEERDGIGLNGLGSKLTVIFSKYFSVYTADKKKSFFCSWSNNLKTKNNDLKISKCNDHFTEFQFDIDWSRFEDIDEITNDFVTILEKRIIDLCAANPGLTATFKFTDNKKIIRKSKWCFKKFEDYIELYSDFIDQDNVITYKDKQKEIWVYPDNGLNIGFVNGAECSKGTHIKAIRTIINDTVSQYIQSKKKIDINSRNVDNKYTLFCNYHIVNPNFNSQTKEELTTPVEKFSIDSKYKFTLSDIFLKAICKSEIVNIVIDWYKQKQDVEDQKTIRKLNKQAKNKIRNNDKFIDANSKKPAEKQLWIFEGDSARAGFRMARDPRTQAAYLLKGVILNTSGLSASKIMENKELSDIVTILGLQWGTKIDPKKLNFGKIVIATDADFDGSHICGLLLNFFNIWPELYESCIICRSITPIIIATKGTDVQNFYSLEEFKKKEKSLKGYKIKYAKGLGSLSNSEYKSMMQKPRFHYYRKDELSDMNLRLWFNKNIAKERKNAMKGLV